MQIFNNESPPSLTKTKWDKIDSSIIKNDFFLSALTNTWMDSTIRIRQFIFRQVRLMSYLY